MEPKRTVDAFSRTLSHFLIKELKDLARPRLVDDLSRFYDYLSVIF